MRAIDLNRFSQVCREYFTWWLSQMRTLLPERSRAAETSSSEVLIVESDAAGSMLTASMRRGDRVTVLGRFPSDPTGLTALRNADRKSTRLNSSHPSISRMPSSA